MSQPQPPNIGALLDTLRCLCISRQDWIALAKKGEIKCTPEQIGRQESIVRDLIAIGELMKEQKS